MSPEQKQAWFIVGLFAVAFVGFLFSIPLVGLRVALAVFAVLGLGGLGPLLFRKKKRDAAEIAEDERDKMIAEKATLAGGMASYTAFVLTCMTTWFVCMCQGKEAVTIHALGMIVLVGMVVLFVIRSVVLLILYGRESSHGEE